MSDRPASELRAAASVLKVQSFDTEPLIPIGVALRLADWLDCVVLSWEAAQSHDGEIVHYLASEPSHPILVARAVTECLGA